jgi:hypothetical protein
LSQIWARFSTEYLFYYVFHFIRVFRDFAIFGKNSPKPNFQLFKPGLWAFFDSLLLLISYQNSEFSLYFGVNFLVSSLQITC